jgi:hypothetical protein
MYRIVPAMANSEQHLQTLILNPELYRPVNCQQGGRAKPWCHRHYKRKADRLRGVLNPILVPRLLCRGCGQSCSCLLAFIAPRHSISKKLTSSFIEQIIAEVALDGLCVIRISVMTQQMDSAESIAD